MSEPPPTPALPIKERIVAAIATQLVTITKGADYNYTPSEVLRPFRTGQNYTPQDLGIYVLQAGERRFTTDDITGNPPGLAWRLVVTCDLVISVSEESTTPMDTMLNLFEADVRKALMADNQWGGLALRSELGACEYPEPTKGIEGVTVPIVIIYRVAENDPTVNMASDS
jgi:hypothetical protein